MESPHTGSQGCLPVLRNARGLVDTQGACPSISVAVVSQAAGVPTSAPAFSGTASL